MGTAIFKIYAWRVFFDQFLFQLDQYIVRVPMSKVYYVGILESTKQGIELIFSQPAYTNARILIRV